ncbi:S24 family peptidase [Burkholderia sp. 572]|uniref:S24 family peptidase n=1 Tax=Burkholderia sp. 572 TaxID=3156414 RepID=UPI003392FAB5
MKELPDIRRQNLQTLVDEHTLAEVSRRTKKPARQISDMLAARKSFGEKVARAMEASWDPDLPPGWLDSERTDTKATGAPQDPLPKGHHPVLLKYPINTKNFRCVFVVGRAQGGLPERIWTDGDYPVGATDDYAEIATGDPHAFLSPVVGTSMAPRFNPGEFALVEPGTEPEIEDDVLVRLASGETMLKRLLSRRGGLIRLGSYSEHATFTYRPEEITWMYYVAHQVPARKIKIRM